MQRSRIAFLGRKAFNNNSNKFSVPLLLLFWWVSFLFIAHAHATGGKSMTLNDKTSCQVVEPGLIKGFLPGAQCPSAHMCCHSAYWGPQSAQANTRSSASKKQSEEESQNYSTTVKDQVVTENLRMCGGSVNDTPKSDRLIRDVPVGLDEFKNKAINPKGKPINHQPGSNMRRVEPGGKEYNFASASKGAKVLAFNKEAKGAPNILGKDVDKYLRNPCSVEGKFVVIELSEETLVNTIEIANFEHHSSNFKDFELLGSLVYPTESWVPLGNFTAKNVKLSQRFPLKEPKWVRYLKLIFLNHYGSEFYCTLSTVEVYGVDAVEHMLEDLISVQENFFAPEESTEDPKAVAPQVKHSQMDGLYQKLVKEDDPQSAFGESTLKHDASGNDVGDQVGDLRHQPVGRMPGDSVLKILLQKVRSLDLNLSVLERYLEELNSRYGSIFTDFEKEIAEKNALLKGMRSDLMNLSDSKEAIGKNVQDIMSWKLLVSLQMDILERENTILRSKVESILGNQVHMENKEIIVLLISLFCSMLASVKLFVDMTGSICRRKLEFRKFLRTNLSLILVLSCFSTIGIICLL
ncbi:Galactose-binding domain-like [Melia azedarach]|uniref:Galactose-binding domain-like n=1 Tax=Melia azedarach TaxID=155640 RepID=A0ACC1XWF4_MELAZ|nr:Galactose-binding domain-like [Melia azedarach]